MMSLWCIFGSPLMLGAEMTQLDDWTLSLLQNEPLLRLLNGHFTSRQLMRSKQQCIWKAEDQSTGEHYIALFNLTDAPRSITLEATDFAAAAHYTEVWSGQTLTDKNIHGIVPPHGALLFHNL